MTTLETLKRHDEDNKSVLMSIFALFGVPNSMLDIGSGSNVMVQTALKLGVDAIGIDLHQSADIQHDLNDPIDLNRKFDLVLCIEVAEHLKPESADILVQTIANHMHVGSKLIFTSALPGQGGDNHLNEQNPVYWRSKLHDKKISYQRALTAELALIWTYTAGALANWLPANLQVFDS